MQDGAFSGRAPSDGDDNSSMMAFHTHASAVATHGQRTAFGTSITDERRHTQIENDGDDEILGTFNHI